MVTYLTEIFSTSDRRLTKFNFLPFLNVARFSIIAHKTYQVSFLHINKILERSRKIKSQNISKR